MLNLKIVGCGAAGNKALANLVDKGFSIDQSFFVNSTDVDIPGKYRNNAIIFGKKHNRLGGCGKERSIGKKMLLDDLRTDAAAIDAIAGKEDAIILVGSTEGGSGSSSIPLLAKYFSEVYHKPVIVILFFGFNDDIRGLQNSIEICQELSNEYTIIAIDNSSFLDECNGNRFKAEKAANEKFAEIVGILMGKTLLAGDQVIDDTDLFKVITTPGYMVVDWTDLPSRIKNKNDYAAPITDIIRDHSHFIDPPKQSACKRIACIFNLNEVDDNIDYSCDIIAGVFGKPYEYFISLGECQTNQFYFIASGMKFPQDTIQKIYDEYKARSESMDKTKDTFFDEVCNLKGNSADSQFDMLGYTSKINLQQNKSDFFGSFGISEFNDKGNKVTTSAIPDRAKEEY